MCGSLRTNSPHYYIQTIGTIGRGGDEADLEGEDTAISKMRRIYLGPRSLEAGTAAQRGKLSVAIFGADAFAMNKL